jgi:two-component system osmolarity sensor histidine kinase EnvZ
MRLEVELSDLPAEAQASMVDDLEQMDQVVAQFLDYARSEPAQPKADVDLSRLVEQAIEASRLERDDRVDIERSIEGGVHLQGLAVELARALANLLTNADRYGRDPDSGRLALAVRLRKEAKEAVIEIADRGPGAAPDRLEQLLRPFVRGDNSRAGVAGTGLGLAIVERIARLHGGRLTLSANAPRGLCAALHLPLAPP